VVSRPTTAVREPLVIGCRSGALARARRRQETIGTSANRWGPASWHHVVLLVRALTMPVFVVSRPLVLPRVNDSDMGVIHVRLP
jgi:hypothetical protein